jgi:predicted HTH transcriptional regulator
MNSEYIDDLLHKQESERLEFKSAAADVLFGKRPSSRLPQTRIRGTVYATNKGGDFVDDRLFEGNAMALRGSGEEDVATQL